MRRIIAIAFLVCISSAKALNSGNVCLGKNESKLAIEHGDQLYITINSKQKFYFNKRPYKSPRLIDVKLPTDKEHIISIYLDDKLLERLYLDFADLKSSEVTIWRDAGGWQLLTGLGCGAQ